jgi:Protein of unknown function (DUF1326)
VSTAGSCDHLRDDWRVTDELTPWHVHGTYLDACNCDPICPCRRIGGRVGGRSTHGVCLGALSWSIEEGRAGRVELGGLSVVMGMSYSDDEEGSPWTLVLHVDERGDEPQRAALAEIFLGRLGGDLLRLPWVRKPVESAAVRVSRIELDHSPGRGWFRAGREVVVRVSRPFETAESVTCIVPGHDRLGRELHAELIEVHDGPLEWELRDRCAFEAPFSYSSDGGA